MNKRRILTLALGAGLVCHPGLPRAQTATGNVRRVGVFAPSTRAREEVTLKPFFDQMRQLGWIEGQNIAYARVYADDRQDLLPSLAAELVARKPEVIFAPPSSAAIAAKQATHSIPIIFATATDPVRLGLVMGLAHPGGNVTGISSTFEGLISKRVELLREIMPTAKRLGFLADRAGYSATQMAADLAPMVSARGLMLFFAEPTNPVEFDAAMANLVGNNVHAIYGTSDLASNLRVRMIELANRARVPVIVSRGSFVDDGALFSYNGSLLGNLRRSAQLVDKILKGAEPADIPVEQPTVFEFVLNMKTAKAFGIKVPQSLLLRADRVIE